MANLNIKDKVCKIGYFANTLYEIDTADYPLTTKAIEKGKLCEENKEKRNFLSLYKKLEKLFFKTKKNAKINFAFAKDNFVLLTPLTYRTDKQIVYGLAVSNLGKFYLFTTTKDWAQQHVG